MEELTMSNVAVVYWSGSGNTEKMANAVADGIRENGSDATVFNASEFGTDKVAEFDAIAFGCPAMGAEELEDSEFAPMFDACVGELNNKKIALFGSYGWGDGEWMRSWESQCQDAGAVLACESVMANYEPDDSGIADCKALGAALC